MFKNKLIVLVAVMGMMTCLSLFACAPTPTEKAEDGDEALSVVVDWSMTSDCAVCHATEQSSTENSACLAFMHRAAGMECVTCHSDEAALGTIHEGAAADSVMPKRLKDTVVSEETCLVEGCHVASELMAATAEITLLTDADDTVVNPHDLPQVEGHDDLRCVDCHVMHAENDVAETAPELCISCHHDNVYECYTCHE